MEDMLENFLKEHVTSFLKEAGFKKRHKIWNKNVDGLIQVINFQSSSFSTSAEVSFTINVGVFNPKIWTILWDKKVPKFINEIDCFPRVRIGELIENGKFDKWWKISDNSDFPSLGKEIQSLIQNNCFTFLDTMMDERQIIEYYTEHVKNVKPIEKIELAIVKNSIGDIEGAQLLLNDVANISENFANRVDFVRSQM